MRGRLLGHAAPTGTLIDIFLGAPEAEQKTFLGEELLNWEGAPWVSPQRGANIQQGVMP
jgi:hypothetical protein